MTAIPNIPSPVSDPSGPSSTNDESRFDRLPPSLTDMDKSDRLFPDPQAKAIHDLQVVSLELRSALLSLNVSANEEKEEDDVVYEGDETDRIKAVCDAFRDIAIAGIITTGIVTCVALHAFHPILKTFFQYVP